MERTSTNASRKHIRTLFRAGTLCGLADRELLELFVARDRDGDEVDAEAAFEVLVKRHGPMVRRLCRSLMYDRDDADDAFQATFLVLARRAASIQDGAAVASWLYGVAGRVVERARAEARRRGLLERVAAEQARHEAIQEPKGPPEPMPELYEEVARLPEHYRAPIVLCYLEGQTHEQAARILRCKLRTLQTRLQRGKARLRLRLVRRGLAPATALLAAELAGSEHPAAAASAAANGMLSAGLSDSTARASVHFAAARATGLAPSALGLAQDVLKTLFWNRMRCAAGLAAGLAIVLTLTFFALAAAVQDTGTPADTVTVRVLDDRRRPISGADVWMQFAFFEEDWARGHGTTDGQGRSRMPVPAYSRRQPPDQRFALVWAHAPGHQMATANGWRALVGEGESVDMTLGPLTDTEFLVLDPTGKPVAGATVEARGVKTPVVTYSPPPEFIRPLLQAVTGADGRARLSALPYEAIRSVQITTTTFGIQHLWLREPPTGAPQREIRLRSTGHVLGRIVADRPEWARGVKLFITTTSDLLRRNTAGTAEVVSRADGFFLIPAIARGRARFRITVDPALPVLPRVPEVEVQADAMARVEIRLDRTVRVRGAIRSRETGDPVAGAEILIGHGAPKEGERGVSDPQGRFEVNTLSGEVTMRVTSMPASLVQLGDDPSSVRHRVPPGVEAFDLPPIEVVRAIKIHGRIVDVANQAVSDVSVYADAVSGNRQYCAIKTDHDGAFTMLLPAGVPLKYRFAFEQGGVPANLEPVGEARIVRENPLLLRAAPRGGRPQEVEGQPESEP
jgi:RNA polymerase sigma factor (sigma-70 family)